MRLLLFLLALSLAHGQQIRPPRVPGSTNNPNLLTGVRSVAITVPSSLVASGGPITGVGTINIQEAPGFRRYKQATAPATCDPGDLWFDTEPAVAGQNLYGCTAANTWALMSGPGGGSGITAGLLEDIPATCTQGEMYYAVDASYLAGTWAQYHCTDADTWAQVGLQADGTGYLTVVCSAPGVCLVGPNTAVIPSKTQANAWTGANDFSGASKTVPFRLADTAPETCDEEVREAYYNTAEDTLYFCTAEDTWTPLTGAAEPTAGFRLYSAGRPPYYSFSNASSLATDVLYCAAVRATEPGTLARLIADLRGAGSGGNATRVGVMDYLAGTFLGGVTVVDAATTAGNDAVFTLASPLALEPGLYAFCVATDGTGTKPVFTGIPVDARAMEQENRVLATFFTCENPATGSGSGYGFPMSCGDKTGVTNTALTAGFVGAPE